MINKQTPINDGWGKGWDVGPAGALVEEVNWQRKAASTLACFPKVIIPPISVRYFRSA